MVTRPSKVWMHRPIATLMRMYLGTVAPCMKSYGGPHVADQKFRKVPQERLLNDSTGNSTHNNGDDLCVVMQFLLT